ncbi:Ref family recombination enhancement nuclease, partial [Escherichia coli]|uniref:Ref family recombination enhancement nuclease n=1 Tax=Escherichia coli TaxID=562 RepID=UPI001FCA640F
MNSGEKINLYPLRPKKTRTSRGLKGRSLTADERRIQTAIGTLPCIACHIHGQHSPVVSLHHIFG